MRRRMFAGFFAVALLVRLAIAAKTHAFTRFQRSEMEVIALNVAQFGDYSLFDTPTAHCTPVFPLLLAGIFSLCGTGLLAQTVSVTLACAVSALRCGLVPLFALDAGFDRRTALLAGGLSAVYIGSVETEVSGGVDGPFVAIALLVLIWAAMRMWRDRSWQTRTPWWFFAFCGFSVLLNPILLPVIGGLLLAGAVACPTIERPRYGLQTMLVGLGILVFLLPWSIRNYLVLGSPIFTRSNFGLEFWVSNGPDRSFDISVNYHQFHPSSNPPEAAKVGDLGEVEYNRVKLAEAMQWVRKHPADFLRLTAIRVAAWWFPPRPSIVLVPKLVLTLLAFAGLWLMFQRQPLSAWLFLITWATFPDVHYLVQWIGRYRTPMDWQMLLCAALALSAAWQAAVRFRREQAGSRTDARNQPDGPNATAFDRRSSVAQDLSGEFCAEASTS